VHVNNDIQGNYIVACTDTTMPLIRATGKGESRWAFAATELPGTG
jgi:hypothetical protein